MMQTQLLPEMQRRIDDEVEAGETLRWAGQPDRGRMARRGAGWVLAGVIYILLALAWIGMTGGIRSMIGRPARPVTSGNPFAPVPITLHVPFLGLLGIPLVLAGVGMMLGPLWLSLKATRTAYAVTDRRVLLFEGGLWRGMTIRTLGAAQIGDRSRTQRDDGSGDLVFNRLP
ncbi:MAG: hypothetical protein M3Y13_13735, partial [Armatimonadota bacterium]|nr:hypothetical protein [Armatimonadota bacterium]